MRRRWLAYVLVIGAVTIVGGASAAQRVGSHARFAAPASRAPQVLTERSLARLRDEGRAVLWVFFTDKAEGGAASFARGIRQAGDRMTAASKARRAREQGGRFIPDYYDLPVPASYVEAVVSSGARLRHVSRWLNAASVEADEREARRIADLPFVRVVTPARRSHRVQPVEVGPTLPPVEPERGDGPAAPPRPIEGQGSAPTLPKPINYGGSFTPLTGINAIAAHDSGWSAATVIVGMFDSGFNKSHNATLPVLKLAERDFVFGDGETANQAADNPGAWDHGTGTWSVLGGYYPNNVVGLAYNAIFFLAKTEDIRSETPVEEDNWVAGAEMADSLGVDVISSSLAYLDFDGTASDYAYTDLDGYTTVVSLAAILAARRGIIVANAIGNTGPGPGSLWAPADAESILAIGSVSSGNFISNFSARGPTADGRTKPEVVAQGEAVTWAVASNPSAVAPASGTSLSTPLVGGAAALVREAHPEWTVVQVREALMLTADKAAAPDNNFGWGRINVVNAIYGSIHGGPVAPLPFNLLVPANNTTVNSVPVTFKWRKAADLQGGALSYAVELHTTSPDSCVFEAETAETTIVYGGYLGPSRTYEWRVVASDAQGNGRLSRDRFRFTTSSTTGVPVPAPPSAAPYVTLSQNRPNPARSTTQIDYTLTGPAGVVPVTLRVFSPTGRLVRTLEDRYEGIPAECSVRWDGLDETGRRAGSGIYYYQLSVAGKGYSKRLILLR